MIPKLPDLDGRILVVNLIVTVRCEYFFSPFTKISPFRFVVSSLDSKILRLILFLISMLLLILYVLTKGTVRSAGKHRVYPAILNLCTVRLVVIIDWLIDFSQ